jgi:hypothetical protein
MIRLKHFIIFSSLSFILFSCSSSRTAVQTSVGESNAAAYIEQYKDLAVSEMKRTGIPASITLAQGMIESDFGWSTLAREANNHFGIKCHDDWTGPTIRHHDDRRNECFRKYSRPEDSFYDHSDFLKTSSRYTLLFDLSPTDYKAWAKGLKKAGYATNPDYANMLIRKIEENNLSYYDSGYQAARKEEIAAATDKPVAANPPVGNPADTVPVLTDNFSLASHMPRIMENNRIQYIIVRDGETKATIEKEFQKLKWELAKYNELDSEFVPAGGQLLYLQPKRDKAEPGKETHVAAEGDTMYSISQKYGLKLKKLYEYNRMAEGEEPVPGTRLWLRSMKSVN